MCLLSSGAELQPSQFFGDGRRGALRERLLEKLCVLYIESDGAGDPALSPADWPALGDHARGLSNMSCVDTLIPPLRRSSDACTPPPLTAGWVGPTCSVGGGTAGRGGFTLVQLIVARCFTHTVLICVTMNRMHDVICGVMKLIFLLQLNCIRSYLISAISSQTMDPVVLHNQCLGSLIECQLVYSIEFRYTEGITMASGVVLMGGGAFIEVKFHLEDAITDARGEEEDYISPKDMTPNELQSMLMNSPCVFGGFRVRDGAIVMVIDIDGPGESNDVIVSVPAEEVQLINFPARDR